MAVTHSDALQRAFTAVAQQAAVEARRPFSYVRRQWVIVGPGKYSIYTQQEFAELVEAARGVVL